MRQTHQWIVQSRAQLGGDLALAQHEQYVAMLQRCGVEVINLDADEAFPDGCFVEDTALITMPPAAGPTRMLEHWLAVNNLEAGRRLTCNNLAAIASLIAAGVGIGLFPHGWLQQMAQRGAVVQLSSRPALPELEYTFQWRRDDTRPLLAHLRDAVARTVDFSKPSPLW